MAKTKFIHVNQQFIRMNAKDGGRRPVCTMKEGRSGKARYARDIEILGPSRMVTEKNQLACGARVWIETEADVILHDEMTFQEAKDTQPETPEEEASRLFDRIIELQDHLGYGFFEEMEGWSYARMDERKQNE